MINNFIVLKQYPTQGFTYGAERIIIGANDSGNLGLIQTELRGLARPTPCACIFCRNMFVPHRWQAEHVYTIKELHEPETKKLFLEKCDFITDTGKYIKNVESTIKFDETVRRCWNVERTATQLLENIRNGEKTIEDLDWKKLLEPAQRVSHRLGNGYTFTTTIPAFADIMTGFTNNVYHASEPIGITGGAAIDEEALQAVIDRIQGR